MGYGGKSSAEATLGRIVKDLEENPVQLTPEDEIYLTLSGGVYQYTGNESVRDSFAKADRALYWAKREGRGRIAYNTDAMNHS